MIVDWDCKHKPRIKFEGGRYTLPVEVHDAEERGDKTVYYMRMPNGVFTPVGQRVKGKDYCSACIEAGNIPGSKKEKEGKHAK